jgi:leucyl aminopeptidase
MATLTGHAGTAWGPYTALIENGPSKKIRQAHVIQNSGESWGDPFEVSSYRKEDVLTGDGVTFDVVQHMAGKPRGHQFAAGFLVIASGISNHGIDSEVPVPYVHVDIAPSACENSDFANGKPTACTVAALTAQFLL